MNIQQHPLFLDACKEVAQDWRDLAKAIKKEDSYAYHVTEETKEKDYQQMLIDADRIGIGEINNFTFWQRVNFKLTGESVALLP